MPGHKPALNSLAGARSSFLSGKAGSALFRSRNTHDPFAIKVMAQGRKIGYVPAKTAALIQPQLVAQMERRHAVVARARVAWLYINRRQRRYTGYLRLTQSPFCRSQYP